MKKLLVTLCLVASFGTFILPVKAALVTYTDRATFEAAVPGLPVETFENNSETGFIVTVSAPLNSANPDVFSALQPGFEMNTIPDSGSGGSDVLALYLTYLTMFFPTATDSVGNNTLLEGVRIDFTAANAVGFDSYVFGGQGFGTVSFYDGAELLWSVSDASANQFFGVVNTGGSITHVTMTPPSPAVEPLGKSLVIDNLAFGFIPEPGMLTLMTIGLAGFGGLTRRRCPKRM